VAESYYETSVRVNKKERRKRTPNVSPLKDLKCPGEGTGLMSEKLEFVAELRQEFVAKHR